MARRTKCIDWKGTRGHREQGEGPHANSRFTAPASNNPALARGIRFGQRRPDQRESFLAPAPSTSAVGLSVVRLEHGTFLGATMASEMTAAGGRLRSASFGSTPMAMLPFCDINDG